MTGFTVISVPASSSARCSRATGPISSARATPGAPCRTASCRWTYSVDVGARQDRSAVRRASSRSAGNASALQFGVRLEQGLLGVLQQQPQQVGGPGQPAERLGSGLVPAQLGVLGGEDLGDPGDRGVDPDRVAGADPGDHGAQPGLVGAGQGDVAARSFVGARCGVEVGVGLDDLASATSMIRPAASVPIIGAIAASTTPTRSGRQVARQLGDLAGHPHLGLPALAGRARPGEPVDQVEHVGDRIAGGHHPGAAGHRDLAEAEVLHLRGALTADVDQHVAHPPRVLPVRALRGVGAVQVGPLQQHLQVGDLGQPPRPHRRGRRGQQTAASRSVTSTSSA